MSTPRILNGGCYCGAVRFEVADAFTYAQNCHCSDCRRATGSAFKPFGGIARQALRVTRCEADGRTNRVRPWGPVAQRMIF